MITKKGKIMDTQKMYNKAYDIVNTKVPAWVVVLLVVVSIIFV